MEALKKALNIANDDILNRILAVSERVSFEKNEMILTIGDPQENVYLILQGIVRSYYLDINGNDITKTFMQENEFCVGESLFETGPSIQCFETLEATDALKLRAAKLKEIILSDDALTKTYIHFLEENLIYKMERESSFQLMSATERYRSFCQKFPTLEKRVNQSYIASYLGVAPESLSRIKKTLKGKQE